MNTHSMDCSEAIVIRKMQHYDSETLLGFALNCVLGAYLQRDIVFPFLKLLIEATYPIQPLVGALAPRLVEYSSL